MKKQIKGLAVMSLSAAMVLSMTACGSTTSTGSASEETTAANLVVSEDADEEAETEAIEADEDLPEGMMRSFLTGELVTIEDGMTRPLACMISNVPDSLPQSGISNAGIVYEAVVEGELTRMMAVFENVNYVGDYLGSIRSCRHYYLDYAEDEGALYTHFGWSYVAEDRIKSEGLETIHLMSTPINETYIRATDREAPHNVFTSTEQLKNAIEYYGYDDQLPEDFEGRLNFYTEDTVPEGGQVADDVKIPFTSSCELVYDADEGIYWKYEYGDPQMDEYNDTQLSFKNVIVILTQYWQYNGDILKEVQVSGSGSGYYISDGVAVPITWVKEALHTDQTHYYLEDGSELYMNPGKTYIAITPDTYNVTFTAEQAEAAAETSAAPTEAEAGDDTAD